MKLNKFKWKLMKKKSIFLALENRNVDVEIKVTKNKKNEKKT